jgi:hypothetical protein
MKDLGRVSMVSVFEVLQYGLILMQWNNAWTETHQGVFLECAPRDPERQRWSSGSGSPCMLLGYVLPSTPNKRSKSPRASQIPCGQASA